MTVEALAIGREPWVRVARLAPGGPAAELGLEVGDVIDAVQVGRRGQAYRIDQARRAGGPGARPAGGDRDRDRRPARRQRRPGPLPGRVLQGRPDPALRVGGSRPASSAGGILQGSPPRGPPRSGGPGRPKEGLEAGARSRPNGPPIPSMSPPDDRRPPVGRPTRMMHALTQFTERFGSMLSRAAPDGALLRPARALRALLPPVRRPAAHRGAGATATGRSWHGHERDA